MVLSVGEGSEREQCPFLCPSPTFQPTLLWDWKFVPPLQPPRYFTARGLEFLVFWSASPALPVWSATLPWVLSTHSTGLDEYLTPWLSELHAVWFSGSSGCVLFLNWLLPFFWLCEEAKNFYLHLHLGRNWNTKVFKCNYSTKVLTSPYSCITQIHWANIYARCQSS